MVVSKDQIDRTLQNLFYLDPVTDIKTAQDAAMELFYIWLNQGVVVDFCVSIGLSTRNAFLDVAFKHVDESHFYFVKVPVFCVNS